MYIKPVYYLGDFEGYRLYDFYTKFERGKYINFYDKDTDELLISVVRKDNKFYVDDKIRNKNEVYNFFDLIANLNVMYDIGDDVYDVFEGYVIDFDKFMDILIYDLHYDSDVVFDAFVTIKNEAINYYLDNVEDDKIKAKEFADVYLEKNKYADIIFSIFEMDSYKDSADFVKKTFEDRLKTIKVELSDEGEYEVVFSNGLNSFINEYKGFNKSVLTNDVVSYLLNFEKFDFDTVFNRFFK